MPHTPGEIRRTYSRKLYRKNREKILAYARDWHSRKGPENRKDYYIKSVYGITLDRYKELHADQEGKCAICGQTPKIPKGRIFPLHVDHNHQTGKVRGLLCLRCNAGCGYLEISGWLEKAQAYLTRNL